ncbi:hyalin-like [Diadema antillarum]|uniref:hyalin-like n=1 Tax=Diadema antillarum TaxID=105358 RepID=UPI003A884BEE
MVLQAFRRITWSAPVAEDNVDPPQNLVGIYQSHAPGSRFYTGETIIVYRATDQSGNTGNCSFSIMVYDGQAPTVSGCTSDINATTDPGQPNATVSWTEPVYTDNVDSSINVTSTSSPNDQFAIGSTVVTYNGSDSAGNFATCVFTITVSDDEVPSIVNCSSGVTNTTLPGQASGVAYWMDPAIDDNSGMFTSNSSSDPGDSFVIGSTEVVYTARDTAGNENNCTFSITIIDAEDPVLSCPPNIQASTEADQPYAQVSWASANASDNSGFYNLTVDAQSGANFSIGVTTVTYTVSDASGNNVTCNFTITVEDVQAPVLMGCSSNITVNTTQGLGVAEVSWAEPSAVDNSGNYTLSQTSGPPSGSNFSIGMTLVAYLVKDAAGLNDTCEFTVTVIDNESPVFISCPSDFVNRTDAGVDYGNITWPAPVVMDNSGSTNTTRSHSPGDSFNIGTTQVTYSVVDGSGNSAECIFNITVVDEELPTFTPCPSDFTVNAFNDSANATATFGPITIADNDQVANSSYSHNSGDVFPIGGTAVTVSAVDASGNQATCAFTITVVDVTAPIIAGCPSNVTVSTAAGQSYAVVSWMEPTASDNSGSYVLTFSRMSGSNFDIGTTEVLYIATDDAGNTDRCTFKVTVEDNEAPVFSYCPTDQEAFGFGNFSVQWSQPVVTDNSNGNIALTSNYANGTLFSPGTYEIVYTAVDESGNSQNCSFTLNVYGNDSVDPFVMCPADIVVNTYPGLDYRNVTWSGLTYSDNMEVVSVQSNYANDSSPFYIGTTLVMYNVTDRAGNVASCDFSITVNDGEAPVLVNCSGDITLPADSNVADAVASWPAITATDNSGSFNITSTHSSGDRFSVGTTEIPRTLSSPTVHQTSPWEQM